MPIGNMVQVHEKAVNMARRWSIQNENDLMQEDFLENNHRSQTLSPRQSWDHDYCQTLAQHMSHVRTLPPECQKYQDVLTELKRRDTDDTHPTQYLS